MLVWELNSGNYLLSYGHQATSDALLVRGGKLYPSRGTTYYGPAGNGSVGEVSFHETISPVKFKHSVPLAESLEVSKAEKSLTCEQAV